MKLELYLNKKVHLYLTNKFHYFGKIIEVDERFVCIEDIRGLKTIPRKKISGISEEEEKDGGNRDKTKS